MSEQNESEQRLYNIIKAIALSSAPIMFKGALVTKLVLAENEYNSFSRLTSDIDANWTHGKPIPQSIADSITDAMHNSNLQYHAIVVRPYKEHTSAGLQILDDNTSDLITKMDIDVTPLSDYSKYHYGQATFYGASPDQILADKISSVSSNTIFRRAKDLLDLYALSECVSTVSGRILDIVNKSNRTLGNFSAYQNCQAELAHAYNAMKGIVNRPGFDDVYAGTSKFLTPFIVSDRYKIWLPSEKSWDNVKEHQIDVSNLYGPIYGELLIDDEDLCNTKGADGIDKPMLDENELSDDDYCL